MSSNLEPLYYWKTPSMSYDQKELLCHGYVKSNYDAYMIEPIIHLFALYFTMDKYLLDEIKNSPPKQSYSSPIVCIHSFKWYVILYFYHYSSVHY